MSTSKGRSGDFGSGGGIAAMLGDPDKIRILWRKAIASNSDWPDKDDLLDVIYWARQLLGLALGILWGGVSLYGFLGLVLFLAISTALVHIYVTSYQGVDEDLLGGFWEVAKEGFMSSFATFLVSWIIVYSSLYY